MIIRMNVVLNRTVVVVDSDWLFDNLCGSHLQSQSETLQGAKKIIFTACLSGKLKLEFTSPDVISNSPKPFWRAELISQFFCYSNSSKNITCPSGNLKTEFTCPIAKSTSPVLSDTTFFARWIWSGAATNLAYDRKRIYGWRHLRLKRRELVTENTFADCIKEPEAHNEAQHRPW